MTLSFDGTRYFGWERRDNTDMTIQGKLENVLALMVNEPVEVIGCSRTDAGVHAKAMTANVKLTTDLEPEEICAYLNRYFRPVNRVLVNHASSKSELARENRRRIREIKKIQRRKKHYTEIDRDPKEKDENLTDRN